MIRALATLAALALSVSPALAGSVYTPPAASGGVDGDGTGVTDAGAFRTALSLGTAATANTGTTMGNVVVLGMGATLPNVSGANLTGITSSQISGLGTAAASSTTDFLPAYPADSWDYSWVTADGDPTSLGWSQSGTQTLTVASDTISGVACYSLTPPAGSGTAWISKAAGFSATGSWEMRAKIYWPASSGTAPRYSLIYNPDATASNSKRFEYSVSTAGPSYWNATSVTTLGSVGDLSSQWIDITWRHYKGTGTDVANYFVETWVGPVRVSALVLGALGVTNPAAGSLQIGRSNIGTQTGVTCIAAIRIKNGINVAPPSYTFRSSTYPL